MKKNDRRWRRVTECGLALVMACFGQGAVAQEVSIAPMSDLPGDIVVPALVGVVEEELDNLASAISKQGGYRPTELKALKAKLPKKTAVHGNYTWTDSQGRIRHKVYYGLSGRELDDVITDDLSGGSAVRARARANFSDFQSRLHDIPDVDPKGKPVSRELDAELKVARTLERDLALKRVGPGGTLQVRVSQVPCPSCTKVLNDLAELNPAAPLTVRVHYLPVNTEKLVDAPSARFHRGRQEVLKREVSPGRARATRELTSGQIVTAGCL